MVISGRSGFGGLIQTRRSSSSRCKERGRASYDFLAADFIDKESRHSTGRDEIEKQLIDET
jgi:hypothetical protein